MLDTTRDALRAQLPHVTESDLQAAEERFRRYLELAIEVYEAAPQTAVTQVLTQSNDRGTVIAGQVDPERTFTNTG
jgi:hypothetical protein